MATKRRLALLLHSKAFYLILAAFAVLATIPLLITDNYFLYILTNIIIFTIYASSWNFLANSGQGSLGHAVFLGIGGFSSAIIGGTISASLAGLLGASRISVGSLSLLVQVLVLLVGGLFSAGIGLLIGLACVRLKAWYLAMVTFGFSVIADSLSSQFDSVTHGINGFAPVLLVPKGFPFYLLVISFAAVSISVMFLIMKSRMGLAFRAIRENEAEAKMVGINTAKYKLSAFVISTFFAGVAGGLYIYFIRYVDNSIFSPANSFSPLIMSVIGGLGTIAGPIIGSVLLISVQTVLSLPSVIDPLQRSLGSLFPGVSNVGPPLTYLAIGVFLVVIVIFAPKGVTSLIHRIYNYLRRRLHTRIVLVKTTIHRLCNYLHSHVKGAKTP
jgi:branched-chain amino acid transport system permease protein